MNTEKLLLKKWRSLPQNLQQEVIDFVEFLELNIGRKSKQNGFTGLSRGCLAQPLRIKTY